MRTVLVRRVSRCARGVGFFAVALALLTACSRSVRPDGEARTLPAAEPELAASARAVQSTPLAPPRDGSMAHAPPPMQGRGVAVVELFTSEGCSSCPPADRVLSRLTSRATSASLPVYTLSFHVDYWNYLGWRDRFSSSAYSERQRGYAAINPNGGTYTPQAVVNGEAECVGSDASQIDSLVAAALKRRPRTQVELEAHRSASRIEVSYRVSGDTAGRVLNLALLEPRAESAVASGENAGERLTHVNVVRAFASRALAAGAAGTWSFEPSTDFGARRVSVVAYAEDAAQRDISGATALDLD
jgi:hypothetical protein